LRGPAVAAAAGAGDRWGPRQAQDADLADDPRRRVTIGSAPGQTADHLGRLAIAVVDRRTTEGVDAEVLLAPLLDGHAVLLGPPSQERQRSPRLGFRVGPRIGKPGLAGVARRRAYQALVRVGRRRARRTCAAHANPVVPE